MVRHDAGFAPETDEEGSLSVVSGTRVLVVEVPFGDLKEDVEGNGGYSVLECRFNEDSLEVCTVAP